MSVANNLLWPAGAAQVQGMANGYVRLSHLSKHVLTLSQQSCSTRAAASSCSLSSRQVSQHPFAAVHVLCF